MEFRDSAAINVRKLIKMGYPMKYIAYKIGVNLSTLYSWLREDEGYHRPHPRNLATLRELVIVSMAMRLPSSDRSGRVAVKKSMAAMSTRKGAR